jgi:hypothetical protein
MEAVVKGRKGDGGCVEEKLESGDEGKKRRCWAW